MRTLPFALPGFELQEISCGEAILTITARAISPEAICPSCEQTSHRVHSYYTRSPADLPVSGQRIQLVLQVRRFRCQNRQCQQQTFVERVPDVVPVQARRTTRLGTMLDLIAIAGTAFAVNSVADDGETNWFEGILLITVYALLALAFYFVRT